MNKLVRLLRHFIHELMLFIIPKNKIGMLMSCEQVAKNLAEEKELFGKEKYRMKFHILICQCCTDYKDQLNHIKKNSQSLKTLELTEDQQEQINKSKEQLLERFK